MQRLVLLAACAAIFVLAGTAGAEEEESPVDGFHYFLGASAGFPVSHSSDAFKVGAGVTLGVGYRFTRRLAIQADYFYSSYGIKSDLLPDAAARLTGSQRWQASTLDLSLDLIPPEHVVSLRILAGSGIYWRHVAIEQITGVELATFCAPYAFFCFPSPTPTTQTIGAKSSVDLGFNGGFNLGFSLGYPTRIYVEPRFHYIRGPVIETPSGPRRANGYYVPVVLGFRYF